MDRWTGWSDSLRGVAVGAVRTRCVRGLEVALRPRPALVTDPHLSHRTGAAEPVQLGDHPLTQRRGVEGVHIDLRPALEAGQGGHPPLEHDLPRHGFGDTRWAVVPLLVGRHCRAGRGVQRVQQVRDTADLVVVVLPGQAARAGRPDLQRGVAVADAGHRDRVLVLGDDQVVREGVLEDPGEDLRVLVQAGQHAVGAGTVLVDRDHLHKQLVAIDEHGPRTDRVLARMPQDPRLFAGVLEHAFANRLVVAQDADAVAVAGVGYRYPSLEVWSASPDRLPWEHDDDEVGGVSDLLHALHAASGTAVPTNEEWHHRPPGIAEHMPWQIVLKWRVSTLAGFEGGTKINVNTLDPATLRERVVAELHRLRDAGAVAEMRIGDECRPGAQRNV